MQFENGVFLGAFLAVVFISLGLLFDGRFNELEQEQALYCEMVETFNTTGGEFGWPDYKGTYEGACK
jgi:hypothetical protein